MALARLGVLLGSVTLSLACVVGLPFVATGEEAGGPYAPGTLHPARLANAPPGPGSVPTTPPSEPPVILPTTTPRAPQELSATLQPPPPAVCGPITGFEQFGTWRRGDEPYGTFQQSTEQAYSGSYSGKIAYSFPTPGNDYMVFLRSIPIGGRGTALTAWVYGDKSAHYLNVWVQDNQGEVWQFTFGQIRHVGWQQMLAPLDVNGAWPVGHISGPANGVLDYPIALFAIVLDDAPDSFMGSGAIYIDDLSCSETTVGLIGPPTPGFPQPPSTDVGRIAFAATSQGFFDIYAINPDGTGLKQLTQTPRDDRSPAWSPDGTLIAYECDNGSGAFDLCLMNADGSGKRYLPMSIDGLRGSVRHPTWSPDGRQIALAVESPQRPAAIHIVSVDSGASRFLTNGQDPSWSPTGSQIAFTDGGQIIVINADGSGRRQLTNNAGASMYPTWSPDGTRIACSLDGQGIYLMNADGTGARLVAPYTSWGLAWSPNGSRLAISSQYTLLLMNTDGSGIVNLTQGVQPSWSRTGGGAAGWQPISPGSGSCRLDLIEPADGSTFGPETRRVILRWQLDRTLGPNEYFFVNVPYPHGGATWYDGTWRDPSQQKPAGTRDNHWELREYLCQPDFSDSGWYDWYVEVRGQVGPEPSLDDPVQCKSETRSFKWSGCYPTPTPTPEEGPYD